MDYQDVLNLLYIANSEVWFNERNTQYDSNAVAGSEDTWKRFWELADKNNLTRECSDFLRTNVLDQWSVRKVGANWYSTSETYIGWESEILPLLEQNDYPVYMPYLREYRVQLDRDDEYKKFREDEAELLAKIKPKYRL